jgi:hypothetical protein
VTWALVGSFLLAGPVTSTESAGMAPTADGQYAYVVASECRRGHGWLVKSNRDGTHVRRTDYYVLTEGAPTGSVPNLARMLCYPFITPRTLP